MVRIWFGVEIGAAQRFSVLVSWCVLDAFHKQMAKKSNSRQRQSGKSGACNVLHLTGVVLVQFHGWSPAMPLMSNELDDHSSRDQGGRGGV